MSNKYNSLNKTADRELADHYEWEAQIAVQEKMDLIMPSVLVSRAQQIVNHMQLELAKVMKVKGPTDALSQKRERLLNLMSLLIDLDGITSQNYQLKLLNREMLKQVALLEMKNQMLKKEVEQIKKALDFM